MPICWLTSPPDVLPHFHSGMDSLMALLDFGRATIQHLRLALVMEMGPGVILDMIDNTTQLPFLIAADLGQGMEQFICPVVGEMKPLFEHKLCKPPYMSYKHKKLRVALLGILPHFVRISDGIIDGANTMMIKVLEDRLSFTADIVFPNSYEAAEYQVSENYICVMSGNAMELD